MILAETSIRLRDVDWVPHPEIWILVVGAIGLGWYASRVVEPKAVAAGYAPITKAQRRWYILGIVGIWLTSDWPMHDVSEQYLYSLHMLQHLVLSLFLPAAFVLATPRWMLEVLLPKGSGGWNLLRIGSKPVVAWVIYNALTVFLHWTVIVQLSADSGPLHFLFHLLIFGSGILMWMPVIGPILEWRLPPLLQCIYLFCMSLVPTVPSGWLVFAESVVYRHYDRAERLWGLDAISDQQGAGVVMKLVGGFVLWGIIVVIYARWVRDEMRNEESEREARHKVEREQREAERKFAEITASFADTEDTPGDSV